MRCNERGVALIKKYEGLRLKAYLCPAKVWTIGWGHTGDVRQGDSITEHQAEAILDVDLDKFERGVETLLAGCTYTENEFSALVSFAFNLGLAVLEKSTLLHRMRADEDGVSDEFLKWKYAAGRVLPGLVRRRIEERALFNTPLAAT